MKRILLAALLTLGAVQRTAADDFSFMHLTMQDGLSHNQVNGIAKDDEGFVWVATAWGLNRFDGYNFRIFTERDGDTTALAHNFVNNLQPLGDGKLLVESMNGFQIYDSHTERFAKVSDVFAAAGGEGEIEDIFVDKNNVLWITTTDVRPTCFCLGLRSNTFRTFDLSAAVSSQNIGISAMAHDGNCMTIIMDDGQMVRQPLGRDKAPAQSMHSILPSGKHHLLVDSRGNFWIFVDNSHDLWLREAQQGRWHRCTSAADSYIQVPDNPIKSLTEDNEGRIWVATDHGGMCVVDLSKRTTTLLTSDRKNDRSLQSNSINSVYADNDGVVWLGYYKNGLSVYDEAIFKFSKDRLEQLGPNFTPDINFIEEARNGSLWYGTNGNGLVHVDPTTGKAKIYRHSETDPYSLPSDIVISVYSASNGDIWVGTFLGGLARFDGNRFHRYYGRTDVSAAMAAENVWCICEDFSQNLWIGSLGFGLARYNLVSGESESFNVENGKLTSNNVLSVVVASNQNILLGTANGAAVLTPRTGGVRMLAATDSEQTYDGYVSEIFEDTRGLVWIGTRHGLYIINPNSLQQHHIGIAEGLENEVIAAIIEDNSRNIWVTTALGISKITVGRDTRLGSMNFDIYNYTEPNSIQTMGYNINSIEKTSHGRLMMGGGYGVNGFVPEEIKYYTQPPEVHFVGLELFGQPVKIGAEIDGNCVLPQAMQYMRELTLTHKQNMLRISFSTLSYIQPQKVQFSYCLEGFNNQWFTTTEPHATFTNLAPGNYTLQVRATNCDGVLSAHTASLNIVVLPPWWQTGWAYASYVIITGLSIAFWLRQKRRKDRERKHMQQIEAEIERQQELEQMKQKFFTNVSHELRTPLSLIITPLENLIDKNTDATIAPKLNLIHRNATRLLSLVNQLLDFRKNDAGNMPLNLSEGDLVDFVRRSAQNFQSLSDRNVQFSIVAAAEQILTQFDTDKIDKVVQNLLSNAFKYTPEGGVVVLWVGLAAEGCEAQIRVSDTGIGIPAEYKDKIFDRFFQVPRAEGLYGGSGIGLHLVKEYVQLHGGTISVTDNETQGTVFTVSLPLAAKQQASEETVLSNEPNLETEKIPSRRTILIVDDSADFRLLLSEALTPDYNVCQARNGKEALEVVFASQPDLIVCDIMMPVMDGTVFCRRIKNDVRTSHIPLIMLSSKDAKEHTSEYLSYGADEYLAKPFNATVLKLKIAKLIELGRLRQEKFQHQIEPSPSEITITTIDEALIARAIKLVETNIDNREFKVEELSSELGMSRVTLYKKLLAITGRTPIEFIRIIRLKRAAQMLVDPKQDISGIAYAVGFGDRRYFTNYFKEMFGLTPQEYRDQNASDNTAKIDLGVPPKSEN